MLRHSLALLGLLATTSHASALDAPNSSTARTGGFALLTCDLGTQATSYSPGVTLVEKTVFTQINGIVGGCVSLTNPSFQFGTFSIARDTQQSCLAAAGTTTRTIHWNNGETSTIDATAVVNTKPDGTTVIVATGSVIEGAFEGGTVQLTVVQPNTALAACFTEEGLTAVSGALSLSILRF
jgi:hypothetical protein